MYTNHTMFYFVLNLINYLCKRKILKAQLYYTAEKLAFK